MNPAAWPVMAILLVVPFVDPPLSMNMRVLPGVRAGSEVKVSVLVPLPT